MKKLISICLLLLTVFSMSSIGTMNVRAEETVDPLALPSEPDRPAATEYSVTLNVHGLTIGIGDKYQLKPTIKVPSGKSDAVAFYPQYSNIISVNGDGVVTGLNEGTSGVACQLMNHPESGSGTYFDVCWVTVKEFAFKDVRDHSSYFHDPVYWAVDLGITSGFTDSHGNPTGYFKPNASCTRGQIVTFLYRAFGEYFPVYEPSDVPDFTDVKKKSFYYDAVKWAVGVGVTTGYTDKNGKPNGKFGPEDVCTRAQVVTFLYRLLRYAWDYDTSSVPDFSDVKKDTYYYDAVKWAVASDITTGYSGTDRFGPDDKCTRGQVVTFIYRCFE